MWKYLKLDGGWKQNKQEVSNTTMFVYEDKPKKKKELNWTKSLDQTTKLKKIQKTEEQVYRTTGLKSVKFRLWETNIEQPIKFFNK